MDNYKINIKNGLDISKATVALNELGYVLGNLPKDDIHVIYAMADKSVQYVTYDDGYDYHGIEAKDLTIDQLQELVVLNRNDVNDANHLDDDGKALFITNDNVMYYWGGEGWLKSAYNGTNAYESYLKNRVKPINEPNMPNEEKDPALISGAEAMIAALDGKHVVWQWADGCGNWQEFNDEEWTVEDLKSDRYNFKIMPQTIKVELELPKPFEPKVGDKYWFLDSTEEKGYRLTFFDNDENDQDVMQFGAWRTEEEMKQVVAAWRNSIKELNNAK
ncbi:hypothetical protein [Acinetobacter baumannii]|uniref:hypothetical protein n=1 Tax=Acinetobacter baumannii TaxID=470 RepID=UPI000BF93C2C|nr:hypothetical protein [Acinetobacter baumannii]